MRLWALALHVGIPNELFWELAIPEIEAVVDLYLEHERAETLRAGLIAATVHNANRRPGTPAAHAHDYLPQKRVYMTPEEGAEAMNKWAEALNKMAEQNGETAT